MLPGCECDSEYVDTVGVRFVVVGSPLTLLLNSHPALSLSLFLSLFLFFFLFFLLFCTACLRAGGRFADRLSKMDTHSQEGL